MCFDACCELNPKIAPYRLNEAFVALKASHQPIKGYDFRPETTFFVTHNKRSNTSRASHAEGHRPLGRFCFGGRAPGTGQFIGDLRDGIDTVVS